MSELRKIPCVFPQVIEALQASSLMTACYQSKVNQVYVYVFYEPSCLLTYTKKKRSDAFLAAGGAIFSSPEETS